MATHTVRVGVKENCFDGNFNPRGKDTGIELERGQILRIRVPEKDTWTIKGRATSANGLTTIDPSEDGVNAYEYYYREEKGAGIAPWFVKGALVGSLDDGATFFPVGTALTMDVLNPGRLTLYCWCGENRRNSGSVDVEVEVFDRDAFDMDRDPANKKEIEVYADRHSTNVGNGKSAGVTVKPGDIITIFVNDGDTWREGKADTSEWLANGDDGENIEVQGFLFPLTSLIGSVDAGRYFFPIGTFLQMTALSEGSLTLFCASETAFDNSMSIKAYVGADEAVDQGAEIDVEITYVNKNADLAQEYIKLTNKGPRPADLSGWLINGTPNPWQVAGPYRLGNIDLDRHGEVKIYTNKPAADARKGEYSMGRNKSMAPGPGQELRLFDSTGTEIFVYPPPKN